MRKIRQLRLDKGYTLRQLSELVGVHYSLIQRWETGTRTPKNKKSIQYLEEALDESIEVLLEDADM